MDFTEVSTEHANKCFQVVNNNQRTSNVMSARIQSEALIKKDTVVFAIQLMGGGMNLTLTVNVIILFFL